MSGWFRRYGFAAVLDGLSIGAYPLDADDVAMLDWLGITRVLNLVEDDEYRAGERTAVAAAFEAVGIGEHRVKLTDYGGLPRAELETAVQEVSHWLDEGIHAYVHCRAGWQRSAAVAAGVVALRNGIDIDDALAYVQSRKPNADPLPHQKDELRRWWQARTADEDEGRPADS